MAVASDSNRRVDWKFRKGLHSGAGALTTQPEPAVRTPEVSRTPQTEEWVNEGGSPAPANDGEAASGPSAPRRQRSTKSPVDTVIGCRERALSDLALAATMGTRNGQLRMEHSAAVWDTRANLIQRLDDSFAARSAAAAVTRARSPAPRSEPSQMEVQHVRL